MDNPRATLGQGFGQQFPAAFTAHDDDGLTGGNGSNNAGDLDANAGDDPADTSEATFTGSPPCPPSGSR